MGNDPKSTSIFENRRKSTSIGSFLFSFHCSYFMTPWVHVVACVASAENDPFFDHALHAAIWTQGVIKYEQWKLKRKLPMLVLFRRWIIWPRVRHVQDVLISKAKNAEKIASSYYARHYRAEADQKRIGSCRFSSSRRPLPSSCSYFRTRVNGSVRVMEAGKEAVDLEII